LLQRGLAAEGRQVRACPPLLHGKDASIGALLNGGTSTRNRLWTTKTAQPSSHCQRLKIGERLEWATFRPLLVLSAVPLVLLVSYCELCLRLILIGIETSFLRPLAFVLFGVSQSPVVGGVWCALSSGALPLPTSCSPPPSLPSPCRLFWLPCLAVQRSAARGREEQSREQRTTVGVRVFASLAMTAVRLCVDGAAPHPTQWCCVESGAIGPLRLYGG